MASTSQAPAGGGFCPFSLVLFAGTAYSYLNYLSRKHKKASSLKPLIIAGPSGKTDLISGSPIWYTLYDSLTAHSLFLLSQELEKERSSNFYAPNIPHILDLASVIPHAIPERER